MLLESVVIFQAVDNCHLFDPPLGDKSGVTVVEKWGKQ